MLYGLFQKFIHFDKCFRDTLWAEVDLEEATAEVNDVYISVEISLINFSWLLLPMLFSCLLSLLYISCLSCFLLYFHSFSDAVSLSVSPLSISFLLSSVTLFSSLFLPLCPSFQFPSILFKPHYLLICLFMSLSPSIYLFGPHLCLLPSRDYWYFTPQPQP